MKSEFVHGIGIVLFALVTATAAENVFQPGVQHVCVPNADRSGWDCGTADQPPPGYAKPAVEPAKRTSKKTAAAGANRGAAAATRSAVTPAQSAPAQTEREQAEPTQASRVSPPPPPFLANPNRPRFPLAGAQPAAQSSHLPAAPAGAATTSTAPSESPAEAPPPVTAADAEDGATSPQVDAAATTEVANRPPSTITARTTSLPARPLLAALPGARAFAALSAGHYTLQLTGAASAAAFPELIERLAIDYRHCYVLHVDRDGGDWWLLVYGDFTDLASARAAAGNLPRDPALAAVWPRRVGFLQAEFVPDSNG